MTFIDSISNFQYSYGSTPFSEYKYPLSIGAGYLSTIYLLNLFMRNKNKVTNKWIAVVHNTNMLVISIVCFLGILYGVFDVFWVS